jgi:spore germination cell wall hydrolase CwlJ-like protein
MRHILLALAIVPTTLHFAEHITCYKAPALAEESQVKCLAVMIYGEARGESAEGKAAVAYTAVNRAAKKTLCEVVLAPYQYSIFNNNPGLRKIATSEHLEPTQKNYLENLSWMESLSVALAVAEKAVPDPTSGSTHYLAPKAMKKLKYRYPRWSREYTLTAVIDNHRFYKQPKKESP